MRKSISLCRGFSNVLSGIHTQCADIKIRQILLGHLIDEESGEENHLALWQRFAEVGVDRAEMQKAHSYEKLKIR